MMLDLLKHVVGKKPAGSTAVFMHQVKNRRKRKASLGMIAISSYCELIKRIKKWIGKLQSLIANYKFGLKQQSFSIKQH